MSIVTIENEASFRLRVFDRPGIVLVYFWAPWCEPCKLIRAEIRQAAETFAEKVNVVKVDVDSLRSLAEKYEVMAVPTLLLFKDGKPIKRLIGYSSQQEIEKMLQAITDKNNG
jgi:thioredoxin 1